MDIDNLHKKDLGLKTPNNYFEESKVNILQEIRNQTIPFYKKAIVTWISTAAILFLITLTIFNVYTRPNIAESEDDVLINSLLEEEDKIDDFITQYIEDEILTTELSEK